MANWAAKGKDKDGVSVLHREMTKLYPQNGLMLPVVRWLYVVFERVLIISLKYFKYQ